MIWNHLDPSDPATITISLIDVNDNAPRIDENDSHVTIENTIQVRLIIILIMKITPKKYIIFSFPYFSDRNTLYLLSRRYRWPIF